MTKTVTGILTAVARETDWCKKRKTLKWCHTRVALRCRLESLAVIVLLSLC